MEVYSYDSEYTVTNTIANIPHLPAAVIGIAPQTKQQNTTMFVTFFLQNTDIINLLVHHGALKKRNLWLFLSRYFTTIIVLHHLTPHYNPKFSNKRIYHQNDKLHHVLKYFPFLGWRGRVVLSYILYRHNMFLWPLLLQIKVSHDKRQTARELLPLTGLT